VQTLVVADRIIAKYEVRKPTPSNLVVLFAAWMVPSLCMMAAAFHLSSAGLSVLGMTMLAGPFLLTGLAHLLVWGNKAVHRPRTLGGGNRIPADLYWMISDLLESRGITHVQKYVTAHPEHAVALHELFDVLCSPQLPTRKSWTTAVSLVFISDNDPFMTRDSILTLLRERSVQSVQELKAILEISDTTAAPLASGVL
jgi:hypothetical protein